MSKGNWEPTGKVYWKRGEVSIVEESNGGRKNRFAIYIGNKRKAVETRLWENLVGYARRLAGIEQKIA